MDQLAAFTETINSLIHMRTDISSGADVNVVVAEETAKLGDLEEWSVPERNLYSSVLLSAYNLTLWQDARNRRGI